MIIDVLHASSILYILCLYTALHSIAKPQQGNQGSQEPCLSLGHSGIYFRHLNDTFHGHGVGGFSEEPSNFWVAVSPSVFHGAATPVTRMWAPRIRALL